MVGIRTFGTTIYFPILLIYFCRPKCSVITEPSLIGRQCCAMKPMIPALRKAVHIESSFSSRLVAATLLLYPLRILLRTVWIPDWQQTWVIWMLKNAFGTGCLIGWEGVFSMMLDAWFTDRRGSQVCWSCLQAEGALAKLSANPKNPLMGWHFCDYNSWCCIERNSCN